MNQLDTSPIAAGAGFPVKKGTLDFLQWRDRQIISDLLYQLYPTGSLENNVTAVRGCAVTTGGPSTYNLSAGAIYVGTSYLAPVAPQTTGELFILPAAQSTTISADEAILICAVPTAVTPVTPNNGISYYTGDGQDADIVTFTDGSQHNVHDIRTLVLTHGDSSTPGFICLLSDLKFAYTNTTGTPGGILTQYPVLAVYPFKAFSQGNGLSISANTPIVAQITPTVNSQMMSFRFSGTIALAGGSLQTVTVNLLVNNSSVAGKVLQVESPDETYSDVTIFWEQSFTAGDTVIVEATLNNGGPATAFNCALVVECFDAY